MRPVVIPPDSTGELFDDELSLPGLRVSVQMSSLAVGSQTACLQVN